MTLLPVPYIRPVSLFVGSSVTIKGIPAVSFSLNPQLLLDFHTGPDDKSDITFHFRVYFGNCVVMNSRDSFGWKFEKKSFDMPFEDGKPFELCISVLPDEYRVMVNGKQWYSFCHRVHPGYVKMIQVGGEVSLTSMCICEGEK
ncbi:galactoside-binding soluble lectin 13-like [Hipposideros larvatus]